MRTLIIGSLLILHFLDVYTTVRAGGLAVETNPLAVAIWSSCGLFGIVCIKLISVLLFDWLWVRSISFTYGWIHRFLMSVSILGLMLVTVIFNFLALVRRGL